MSSAEDDEEEDFDPAVVLDLGTCYSRCGFAGENEPRKVFPTLVGRCIRHTGSVSESAQLKDLYVGNEVLERSTLLRVKTRLFNRKREIEHWDEIEKIWQHILDNELQVESSEQPVLYCEEAHLGTCKQREQIAYRWFETFNVPQFCVKKASECALAARGRTTGIVVDVGHESTDISCIYEGFQVSPFARYKRGGHHVTRYLLNEMNRVLDTEHKLDLSRIFDVQVVTDIKRKYAYFIETVISNNDAEEQNETNTDDVKMEEKHNTDNRHNLTTNRRANYSRRQTEYEEMLSHSKAQKNVRYELPDGFPIRIEHRHFWECTENTFFTQDGLSLDRELHSFISNCNKDFQHILSANIVLAGSTTKLPGLDNKLKNYLQSMLPRQKVDVWGPDVDKLDLVWLGGAVVADIYADANDFWVYANEYEETGPNIVHRKCF